MSHDDETHDDPTDLSQARALFSHEPEPAPEPDDELDDGVFTYQPETLSFLPPGTVLITEDGVLTRADVERLSELGSERLSGRSLVLPSGVSVAVVNVDEATTAPKTRSPAEFLSKITRGEALVMIGDTSPKLVVKVEHVEHDRDVRYHRDEYRIEGKLCTDDTDRLPVMRPEDFGLHVAEHKFEQEGLSEHIRVSAVFVLPHENAFNDPFDDSDEPRRLAKKIGGRMFGGVDWGTGPVDPASAIGATSLNVETKPYIAEAEYGLDPGIANPVEECCRELARGMKGELDAMVREGEITGYGDIEFDHDEHTRTLTARVTVAEPPTLDGVTVNISVGSPEAERVKADVERYLKENPKTATSFKVASFNKDVAVEALRQAGGGSFTEKDFDRMLVQVSGGEMTAKQASEFLPVAMLDSAYLERLAEAEKLGEKPAEFGRPAWQAAKGALFGGAGKAWLDPEDFGGASERVRKMGGEADTIRGPTPPRPVRVVSTKRGDDFGREFQQQPPPDHAHCKTTLEPLTEYKDKGTPWPKPREYWLRHSDGEIVVVVAVRRAALPENSEVTVERKTSSGRPSTFPGHFRLGDFWKAFIRVPTESSFDRENVEVDQTWLTRAKVTVIVTGVKSDAVYYRFVDGPVSGNSGFVSLSDFRGECKRIS